MLLRFGFSGLKALGSDDMRSVHRYIVCQRRQLLSVTMYVTANWQLFDPIGQWSGHVMRYRAVCSEIVTVKVSDTVDSGVYGRS